MDQKGMHEACLQTFQRFRRFHTDGLFVDISRGEFFALNMLHDHRQRYPYVQGMYVSELADKTHVTPPAVSRMLKALEQKGLIVRNVDRDDRRNTFIRITDEGEDVREKTMEAVGALFARVFQRMGEEEMHTLLRLSGQFMQIIEEEMKRTQGSEE